MTFYYYHWRLVFAATKEIYCISIPLTKMIQWESHVRIFHPVAPVWLMLITWIGCLLSRLSLLRVYYRPTFCEQAQRSAKRFCSLQCLMRKPVRRRANLSQGEDYPLARFEFPKMSLNCLRATLWWLVPLKGCPFDLFLRFSLLILFGSFLFPSRWHAYGRRQPKQYRW